jgi:hypothetical protein
MSDVQFFHQVRFDGGRRSGVTVDGHTVMHGFVTGNEQEYDPALEWYADVTLASGEPPTDVTARAWLETDGGGVIRQALRAAADRLECGIDSGMPWEAEFPAPAGPARVSVSAVRRLTGREVGTRLRALAAEPWDVLFPTAAPTR